MTFDEQRGRTLTVLRLKQLFYICWLLLHATRWKQRLNLEFVSKTLKSLAVRRVFLSGLPQFRASEANHLDSCKSFVREHALLSIKSFSSLTPTMLGSGYNIQVSRNTRNQTCPQSTTWRAVYLPTWYVLGSRWQVTTITTALYEEGYQVNSNWPPVVLCLQQNWREWQGQHIGS